MANPYAGAAVSQASLSQISNQNKNSNYLELDDSSISTKQIFHFLAGLLAGDIPLFIAALLSSIISVGAQLAIPLFIGQALDSMLGVGQIKQVQLEQSLVFLLISLLIAALSQWLSSYLVGRISAKLASQLRQKAYNKFQRLSISFVDRHSQGDILQRLTSDVDLISDGLNQAINQLIVGLLTIFCTLALMFWLSAVVAASVLLLTPLSIFCAAAISRGSSKHFKRQQSLQGTLAGIAQERIAERNIIWAFNQKHKSQVLFSEQNAALHEVGIKAQFISSLTNPGTRLVNNLIYLAVAVSGILSYLGFLPIYLSIGQIQSLLAYTNQYMKPFNEIAACASQVQAALASARRVLAFLDADEEAVDEAAEALSAPTKGNLSIEGLSFSYIEGKPVLHDINLTIEAGKRYALVGPTGSGKTSILQLILRFYEPDTGVIRLDGKNIKSMSKKSLRSRLGMVLQDSILFEGTIFENIALAKPGASLAEVEAAAKKAHADSFIRQLPEGYQSQVSSEDSLLSSGQKQLICIARIMLSDPDILILDEATSNIDTRTEAQLQAAFEELMQGKTSLIVAHRLSTIQNADQILVLDQGRLCEQGSHEELLARGALYANLYQSQFIEVTQTE